MPAMTAAQKTQATDLQTALFAALAAISTVQGKCDAMMADLRTLNTADAQAAGNAVYLLKGFCDEAKGAIRKGHSGVAGALLAYDPVSAGPIIQGGTNR
jgi:hypothetical protein